MNFEFEFTSSPNTSTAGLAFIDDQLAEQKFQNHLASFCPQSRRKDRIPDIDIVRSMIGWMSRRRTTPTPKKEGVSYTYKKFTGYAPIFAYIGPFGFMLNNQLHQGSSHCNCEGTHQWLEQTLKMAEKATPHRRLLVTDNNIYHINYVYHQL